MKMKATIQHFNSTSDTAIRSITLYGGRGDNVSVTVPTANNRLASLPLQAYGGPAQTVKLYYAYEKDLKKEGNAQSIPTGLTYASAISGVVYCSVA